MDKFKRYDEAIGAATINLFTLSKNNGGIKLCDFDPKNKNHLTLYNIAKNLGGILNYKVALEMSFLSFLKFKIKEKNWFLKRMKRGEKGIHIDQFLLDISIPNNLEADFWCKAYEEYYAKKI